MRTDELDYALPEELIAQRPAERRDASRLLVHRRDGTIEHRRFDDLVDLLDPGDLVVVNSSRVLRARIAVRRPTGGSGEVLLIEERPDGLWEALVRPSRRTRPGMSLGALEGELAIEPVEDLGEGRWLVRPSLGRAAASSVRSSAPGACRCRPTSATPPCPTSATRRSTRGCPGSAAAPTAGLHFTPELWQRLRARCEVVEVELRVGLDTFRPVTAETLEEHAMHSEAYRVEPGRARGHRRRPRRRAGASSASARRRCASSRPSPIPAAPDEGRTSLLIAPGYRFRAVGALVTNFHLPRSTLLALVMAFAGIEETRRIYAEAIRERYRFYSFGDASLLL